MLQTAGIQIKGSVRVSVFVSTEPEVCKKKQNEIYACVKDKWVGGKNMRNDEKNEKMDVWSM